MVAGPAEVLVEPESAEWSGAEERPGAEEGGKLAGLDLLLERVGLRLRDLALFESSVHLVDRGGLGRVAELLRGDAEVPGDGVEERAGGRRASSGGRDGGTGTPAHSQNGRRRGERLARSESFHRVPF